jgi:uncharacterized protein YjbJ (UPF0337 family)
MTKSNKYENAKNKLTGEIKEAAGKITGNEQLELKGKIQSAKADFKKNTNVKNKVHEMKEDFAGKINDMMDSKKSK